MRGNTTRRPDKQLSVAEAKGQLQMLLVNATDQRLALMTPEDLGHTHKLSGNDRANVRECECMLLAERGRRARRLTE